MESRLFILCALLAVICSWSEAAPAHTRHQRQMDEADGPHDVRWRLVTGLETAFLYAGRLSEQIRACDNESLLSPGTDLKAILSGVCELIEVQELTSKVHNGSDLQAVLEKNVLDACHWLNHLVASGELTASRRFLELNETCEIGHMPRLSQYCLETKIAPNYNSLYENAYKPASNFYADYVVNQDVPMWLCASVSEATKQNVLATLNPSQNVSCSVFGQS